LPDNWLAVVGTPGTDIFENSSVVYRTGNSLQFEGTGSSPLSAVVQPFGVSSNGTAGTLTPSTVYTFNCFMQKSAGLVAGAITISLVNSSNAIINDISGTAISFTILYSTLTASWAPYSFSFAAPNTLPSTYKWKIAVSTALTSGQSVYIDDACLVQPTPVYANGPYCAVFAGATNFLIGDTITVTVANNYAGLNQTYWNRLFNLQGMGLQLPSFNNGSQTISDTLISAA
jgi:hypothetical protein